MTLKWQRLEFSLTALMNYKRPIQTDMPQQIVELPWAAWFQDTVHPLCFPSSFSVDVLQPPATDACHQNQIDKALDAPVDATRIEQLCRSSDRVCIVVDDLARPTRMAGVLASVLRRLHDVGIEPSRITIVIATGTHSPLTEQQARWKVSDEIADRYTVKSHDAESTVSTGIAYGKETLKINQTFLQADFKIGITTILPH